jgi:glycosyltransferase involved in cell wall biosynthesis
MRILLIAPQPFYQERGTPIAIRMLVETLCAQGHAVDLLTYHEGVDLEIDGLRIIRTPVLPGVRNVPIGISWKKLVCDVFLCIQFFALALTRSYDVIHAVEEAVFPAVLLRGAARARVVYDMDSMLGDQLLAKWQFLRPLARLLRGVERATIRRVDAIFAVCRDLADHAAAEAPNVPVFLIEDVALPSEPTRVPAERLRESLGIRGTLALYVGNLQRYQGVDQLVNAMALVPPERDVTLVLIGGAASDIARIRGLVKKLNLQRRVLLLGPRPVAHLSNYLAQADVLVSPRLRGNNTPMKVYSYMQSGTAILGTRIRSHTQVLDESCAYLVDATPTALAQGLSVLARDAHLRTRLGATAHLRANESYSVDAFREKVRVAYQSLEQSLQPVEVHR